MTAVAILAGGKGTRANNPDKCWVDVCGKPMILRIMNQFEEQGYSTFVICRGIEGRWEALRQAWGQLGDHFLLAYGDTYTPLNVSDFIAAWAASGSQMITATYDGIDAGINGLTTEMLWGADPTEIRNLKDRKSFLYPISESFHEVGTPEALAETREYFRDR